MTSIAERMEEAADTNLGLPYSLVLDALDTMPERFRGWLVAEVEKALDAYEADPLNYQFNPRATDRTRAEADAWTEAYEQERITGIVRYFDEEAPTAHDSLR